MKFLLFNIVAVLLFTFCKQKDSSNNSDVQNLDDVNSSTSLSPLNYLKWVESKEGFKLTKKIGKIDFQLMYTPSEYLAIKEYEDSLDYFNENKLKNAAKIYHELQYYKFRISIDDFHDEIIKYNIKNDYEYEDRVKYYSFNMRHSLKLIDGKDTLPCVMFNYERTFNLTPNSDFQIAFPSTSNKSSKTLVFDDVFLETGKVMLTITEEKIKSIPKIIF